MVLTFVAARAWGTVGRIMPTDDTGKPVSSWPLAALACTWSATPSSSLVAAPPSAYFLAAISTHEPPSGWRPAVQSVQSVGESHSAHSAGQDSQRPVLELP
jgi:hypothetical protein